MGETPPGGAVALPAWDRARSWGTHSCPQPALSLHSGPCQEVAANGEVQALGCKVAGKLVVKTRLREEGPRGNLHVWVCTPDPQHVLHCDALHHKTHV